MSEITYPRNGRFPAVAESLERRALLAAAVTGFTLIHADTDQPVAGFVLQDGAMIDLSQTGWRLNIRADLAAAAGSVRFNYDGQPNYRIDTGEPFAIGSNSGGDYFAWTPALGTHTLTATAYDSTNATGPRGSSTSVTFTVIDSSPIPSPLRINAGGSSYTTTDGRTFGADAYFSGGTTYTGTFPVAGTLDDTLYRSGRQGASFSYVKPVQSGHYLLTLHFAEPTKTGPGQRKFDVRAQGKLILDDFDVYAAGGTAQTKVTRTVPVTITDGRMNLGFSGVVSDAIVSGVELMSAARTPAMPAPVWMNAGGARYRDTIGRVFEADRGFTGGMTGQANYNVLLPPPSTQTIAWDYLDDPLLLSYRTGANFTFSREITNGMYAVWLEFAEPNAAATAGQRVFDVSAEGALMLNDYDIVADAGAAQMAVARTFNVAVRDGRIDLTFRGEVGQAMVGAIAIAPASLPRLAVPYTLAGNSSDPAKQTAIENARRVQTQANLRNIGLAMVWYANENKGRFPNDLAALKQTQDISHQTFSSPRAALSLSLPRGELPLLEQMAWVDASRDYLYLGAGKNFTAASDVWLAYENPDRVPGDPLYVLFGDGHVDAVPRNQVLAAYGGSATGPVIPRLVDVPGDPRVTASQRKLRDIFVGLTRYASDRRLVLPPDFGTLYTTQGMPPEAFINPRGPTPPPPTNATDAEKVAWINASTDYIYLGGGRRLSLFGPDEVLAYENPSDLLAGINLVFGDGRVEAREMRWALESIARTRAKLGI